jgi:hypothetical protein
MTRKYNVRMNAKWTLDLAPSKILFGIVGVAVMGAALGLSLGRTVLFGLGLWLATWEVKFR